MQLARPASARVLPILLFATSFITAIAGADTWTQIGQVLPPSTRTASRMVYDAAGHRSVLFGGIHGTTLYNDLWVLPDSPGSRWQQLFPSGPIPPARIVQSQIYDPVRNQMLVFGGKNYFEQQFNDLWQLSLGGDPTWSPLAAVGSAPSGRSDCVEIYDPVRDRMIIFGGNDGVHFRMNDTWTLSLGSSPPVWAPLATTGGPPPPRAGHMGIYDPVRDRMIIYGGAGTTPTDLDDVWALTLSGTPTWTQLTPSAGAVPIRRRLGVTAYDPVHDQLSCIRELWTDIRPAWKTRGRSPSTAATRGPSSRLAVEIPASDGVRQVSGRRCPAGCRSSAASTASITRTIRGS